MQVPAKSKELLSYIHEETKFSGIAKYPIGIEDLPEALSTDENTIHAAVQFLRSKGLITFCGLGNSCVCLV